MGAFVKRIMAALAAAGLALGGAGTAHAFEPGKKAVAAAHEFAISNSVFTLYHEIGHLLIDQLELPVLGREEDAADNIATWMMLNADTAEAHAALAQSAYGWLLSAEAYEPEITDRRLHDKYSLDKQRAFNIVCLMVGRDRRAFRPLATSYGIDGIRQQECFWDYDLVDRTMRGLKKSHMGKQTRGTRVNVSYRPADSGFEAARTLLRDSRILDVVAEEVAENYSLPGRVRFTAKMCGEPNAFYFATSVEIVFCYELVDEFIAFALRDIRVHGDFQLTPRAGAWHH